MTTTTPPIVFGEVLFDRFPDGRAILGGAPFNVAWHLQGFGLSPLMIGAVGDDDAGHDVRERMQQWGMDTSGVQVSKTYQTGHVKVSIDAGEPSYEITENQAYDHIDSEVALNAISRVGHTSVLYHGSLIERAQESRQTLKNVMSSLTVSTFVDINLRPPWWTMSQVISAISAASWVKLNEDELSTIMQVTISNESDSQRHAQEFLSKYQLRLLIVTRGGDGAFIVSEQGVLNAAPVKLNNVVDTVGAGDSFSAVMITGMLLDWPLRLSLQRALQFAARICQNQGATTSEESLYAGLLRQWQD